MVDLTNFIYSLICCCVLFCIHFGCLLAVVIRALGTGDTESILRRICHTSYPKRLQGRIPWMPFVSQTDELSILRMLKCLSTVQAAHR